MRSRTQPAHRRAGAVQASGDAAVTRTRRRGARAAVLTALAGLLLAACGADTKPIDTMFGSADSTIGAGTSRLSLVMELARPPGPPLTLRGEGVFDFSRRSGDLQLTFPGGGDGGGDLQLRQLLVSNRLLYQTIPPEQAQRLGRPWVRFDITQMEADDADNLNVLAADPVNSLALIQGAFENVEIVGQEVVRGESTTHYRGTVNPALANATLKDETQARVERLSGIFGPEKFPIDVWIDGEGRARRVSYELTYDTPSQAGLPLKTTLELYEFGTMINLAVPTEDQVIDGDAAGAGG